MALTPQLINKLQETLAHGQPTLAVIEHALDELRRARDMADQDLQKAIAGFRQVFTTVPLEARSGSLLRQAWAVHQALEVVRSLEGALAHLEAEHTPAKAAPLLA